MSGQRENKGGTLTWRVIESCAVPALRELPAGSVQACVTSPPYFGLRDYGHDGQIGLEATPDEYVASLVGVFREVRRVLADDGTLWLNLGDTYAQYDGNGNLNESREPGQHGAFRVSSKLGTVAENRGPSRRSLPLGLKRKDLVGIPWMVAFALRADGWFLRSDIIWAKPNPMPESVTDRPTKAHEYLFLLSKGPRYYYDAEVIAEEPIKRIGFEGSARGYAPDDRNDAGRSDYGGGRTRGTQGASAARGVGTNPDRDNPGGGVGQGIEKRNKRSVWTCATQPFPGAHFATFPSKLIEPCVLAGCPENGTVLDPFCGSGTTGLVALRHGRSFLGIELNAEYVELARRRIVDDAPLLNSCAEAVA